VTTSLEITTFLLAKFLSLQLCILDCLMNTKVVANFVTWVFTKF